MSDKEAERQSALEEKRRAARRARVLGSGSSRLDTICGIPSALNNATKPSLEAEERPVEPLLVEKTSSSPSAHHSDQTPALTPSSPSLATDKSTEANQTRSSRYSGSREPKWESFHPPASQQNSKASSPSSKSTNMPVESDYVIPTPQTNLLSRKQGLLLGFLFALLLALCQVFLPSRAIHAATAFVALEFLMWMRVLRPTGTQETDSFSNVTNFILSSESSPMASLSLLIRYGKVFYFTLQDWLISQFLVIVITAILPQLAIMTDSRIDP